MRAAALALVLALAGEAEGACREALVLGLDISGSVDARDYRLQMDGLAEALGRESVRAALLGVPGAPVDMAIFAWSGAEDQRIVMDWTTLGSAAALDLLIAGLKAHARPATTPATALGEAMALGARMLGERPDCWRQVLDISGDGRSNAGPRPRDVKEAGRVAGIVINALVIGAAEPGTAGPRRAAVSDLRRYFEAEVIQGPDAFVETAAGFGAFADAMERKLLREIQVMMVGDGDPATRAGEMGTGGSDRDVLSP